MKNWINNNIGQITFAVPVVGLISGFFIAILIQSLFGDYLPGFPVTLGEFFMRPLNAGFVFISIISSGFLVLVVAEKHRKWLFYLFFIPLPVIAVSVFLLNVALTYCVIFPEHFLTHELGSLISILEAITYGCWILWHIGWLTVLFWKCKRSDFSGSIGVPVQKLRSFRVYIRSVPSVKSLLFTSLITVFLALVVWGIFAGNSYEGICFGYENIQDEITTSDGVIRFSYEYPACFSAWDSDVDDLLLVNRYSRGRWQRFRPGYGSEIIIECVTSNDSEVSDNFTFVERAISLSPLYFCLRPIDVFCDNTRQITGYSADTMVLLCENNYVQMFVTPLDQLVIRYAEFEANGVTWSIYMDGIYPDTIQHERFYEHLLETFTVEWIPISDNFSSIN